MAAASVGEDLADGIDKTDGQCRRNSWAPSPTVDLVLCSPVSTLHYFGQNICRHLFVCDSKDNPICNIEVSRVRSSALLYALLKYTTAEYHNKTTVDDRAQRTLLAARNDITFYLHGKTDSLTMYSAAKDLLLVTVMAGMIASWDGTNNTGVKYYHRAVAMCNQARWSMSEQEQNFYDQVLVYWWSGLTFVTDTTEDALFEPPMLKPLTDLPTDHHVKPHSLTGVSPQSFRLMGKVGALIYAQRRLAITSPFLSSATVKAQEDMLSQSRQLQQELSSLKIPSLDHIIDNSDTGTSVAEMRNVAEAFRLCALLLLYRCFPDLLDEQPIEEESHERLTALALQALDVIEKNSVTSRTRSVEQILLVVIAGELDLPRPWGSSDFTAGLPAFEPSGTTADVGSDAKMQAVLAARALVCTRMTAVRSILPYKSVEQAEDLIWHVWSRSDNGAKEFWMDVMIRNGQKFVMV